MKTETETKICQNCSKKFVIKPEDFEFYQKIKVPAPTFCPDCRMIRRMSFRNERALYKRKCDFSGKDIISIYRKDSPCKVYDHKYWWSDNWDSMDYGKDYDFSKSFFQQYKELRDNFPLQALSNSNAVNSDFCNVNDRSKDCYLISASANNEKVMYSNRIYNCKDSIDLYIVSKSDLCYENISCKENYKVFFSINSLNCLDSSFLYDCRNCANCFACVNLRNKQYCIFNKQFSKEKYQNTLKSFDLGNFQKLIELKEKFRSLCLNAIHKYANLSKTVDVLGDNIDNAKSCYYCFDTTSNVENCKYLNWSGFNLKDSYDGGPGVGVSGELLYETFDTGIKGSRNFATSVVYESHNIQYAFNCYNCSYLFGCIGLRKKQYCILNKQYSKQEYEELVPKIIEQMNKQPYIDKKGRKYRYGEFFPVELSPFAYNETIAQEYFPLNKEEALKQGYVWYDKIKAEHKPTIEAKNLPDNIKDVGDSIINEIIECLNSKSKTQETICAGSGAFRIIPKELEFYKKMNLPLPRLCPDCRHRERIKQRNPLKLWKRKCQCAGKKSENGKYQNTIKHFHGDQPCPNEFETSYSPERKEIVYCEKCYQAEVV